MLRRLLLICIIVAGSARIANAFFPFERTRISREDERPVRVQVGNVVFDVPRNARDIDWDSTGQLTGFSMRLLFPEMRGWTRSSAAEFDIIDQRSRALQILVSGRSQLNPETSQQLTNKLLTIFLSQDLKPNFGDAIRDLTQQKFDNELTEFRLASNSRRIGGRRWDMDKQGSRVFAELQGENAASVMLCSGMPGVPNPGCELYFPYRDITAKVSFRLSLLSQWKAIRDGLQSWLDRHAVDK